MWSFHTRDKRFLNEHKYVPMDWWEALRLPGAWDYVPGTRSSTANPVAGPMPFDVMEEYVAYIAQRFRSYEPMFFISGDTLWESPDERGTTSGPWR